MLTINPASAYSPAGSDVYFALATDTGSTPRHCATLHAGAVRQIAPVVQMRRDGSLEDAPAGYAPPTLTADDVALLRRVLGQDQQDAAWTAARKGMDDVA